MACKTCMRKAFNRATAIRKSKRAQRSGHMKKARASILARQRAMRLARQRGNR